MPITAHQVTLSFRSIEWLECWHLVTLPQNCHNLDCQLSWTPLLTTDPLIFMQPMLKWSWRCWCDYQIKHLKTMTEHFVSSNPVPSSDRIIPPFLMKSQFFMGNSLLKYILCITCTVYIYNITKYSYLITINMEFWTSIIRSIPAWPWPVLELPPQKPTLTVARGLQRWWTRGYSFGTWLNVVPQLCLLVYNPIKYWYIYINIDR